MYSLYHTYVCIWVCVIHTFVSESVSYICLYQSLCHTYVCIDVIHMFESESYIHLYQSHTYVCIGVIHMFVSVIHMFVWSESYIRSYPSPAYVRIRVLHTSVSESCIHWYQSHTYVCIGILVDVDLYKAGHVLLGRLQHENLQQKLIRLFTYEFGTTISTFD